MPAEEKSGAESLASACGEFAGGVVAEGTECIVVLKRSGGEGGASKTDVVATVPTVGPKELVVLIAGLAGIPTKEIEIFVYAVCGGARGKDV